MEKVVAKIGKELLLAGLVLVAAVALWVGFDKPAYASASSDLIIVASEETASEPAAEEAAPAAEGEEMKSDEAAKEGEAAVEGEATPAEGEAAPAEEKKE